MIKYVKKYDKDIQPYLEKVLETMFKSVSRGLYTSGILQGGLNVERKAPSFFEKYLKNPSKETLCYAASLAVAEENASGGEVVTSPTCGSSGVVPGVLYTESIINHRSTKKLVEALMVGGLIGN